MDQNVQMFENAFEELTVERGDNINILGMTVHVDRANKRALINQRRFVDKLTATYGITSAVTPSIGVVEKSESKLLEDQRS